METENNSEVGELYPISLEETCVIGSILYKDYQTDGTEGNIRGHRAIDSLVKAVDKGCKASIIISQETDKKFISDLKGKLSNLGDKSENVVWHMQSKTGYSEARREAIELAKAKYPETRAFIMQEIEKDLTSNYDSFVNKLSDNKILVMMNRGVNIPYNENPWQDTKHLGANLPREQFWGERHQNIEMANQESAAGLTKEPHFWDRLNGTRIIRNERVKIGDVEINPTDLMLLKYKYSDGYSEEDRKNKIDTYSASVYNLVPILESLGGEDKIAEVPVEYIHSEGQRQLEEGNSEFKEKRLGHKVDLPAINFDIVANIKEWKKEGRWPQVLLDALKTDKTLEIKHFDKNEYSLTGVNNPTFGRGAEN
ncbi:MAG: hypothetical protein ACD_13C00010G0042 [uncultured bacterium]|nr:MAG: hypothetical protein ACD_13C00010G0042 [uncultured bacterium]